MPSDYSMKSKVRRFVEFPPLRIAIGLILAVVLLVPAQLVAAGATSLGARGVVAELYTGVAAGIALWLVGRFIEKRSLAELGLPADGRILYVVAGLAVGAAVAGAAIGMLAILHSYSVVGSGDLAGSTSSTLLLFAFELGSAALQAVLFYGIVFRVLVEWLGRWPAVALSIIFFGAIHLSAAGATVVSAVVVGLSGGILLPASYLATRMLWLPMGILWGINFTLDEVFGAIPSSHHRILEARITGSDILTGGPVGVEGGIATLVAAWIAIVLVAWWSSTRSRVPPTGL